MFYTQEHKHGGNSICLLSSSSRICRVNAVTIAMLANTAQDQCSSLSHTQNFAVAAAPFQAAPKLHQLINTQADTLSQIARRLCRSARRPSLSCHLPRASPRAAPAGVHVRGLTEPGGAIAHGPPGARHRHALTKERRQLRLEAYLERRGLLLKGGHGHISDACAGCSMSCLQASRSLQAPLHRKCHVPTQTVYPGMPFTAVQRNKPELGASLSKQARAAPHAGLAAVKPLQGLRCMAQS